MKFSFTKKEVLVIRVALRHYFSDLESDGITDEEIVEEEMRTTDDLLHKLGRALL